MLEGKMSACEESWRWNYQGEERHRGGTGTEGKHKAGLYDDAVVLAWRGSIRRDNPYTEKPNEKEPFRCMLLSTRPGEHCPTCASSRHVT